MPLPEAIALIEGQLENVFNRPDVRSQGTKPTSRVYRAGTRGNIHGELAHFINVEIEKPKTRDFTSDGDIEFVHATSEAMLIWLAGQDRLDTMLIWWVNPPTVEYNYEDGALAIITIPLCERYPRA